MSPLTPQERAYYARLREAVPEPRDFRIHPLNRRHGRTPRFVVLAALVCVLLGVMAWRAWS